MKEQLYPGGDPRYTNQEPSLEATQQYLDAQEAQ